MLRRRWWVIALLVAASVVVALIASTLAPPAYRSSERLQVNVLDEQEVTLFTRLATSGVNDQMSFILTDFSDILRSPLIAWRTIDDLNLGINAQSLLSRLDVAIAGEFITITYEDNAPARTQQVLSQHVQNAIDYYESLRARPAQSTGQFLRNELDQQGQLVAAAQSALRQFQLQHNIGDLEREINALQDVLRGLEAERNATLVEAGRAAALAASWNQFAEDSEAKAEAARQQLATLAAATPEIEADAAATDATAAEPAAAAQIAALQAEIEAWAGQAQTYRATALAQEATVAGQQAAAAEQDGIISQRATDLAQVISLSSDYETLQTNLRNAQADYDFLRAKLVEAELKERQVADVGYLQVVEPAYLPTATSTAPAFRLALLAALISLLLGMALVLVLESVRTARRSQPDSSGVA